MSTGMTSQDSLTINIVCVIVTPAYMVSRDQHVIKVLLDRDKRAKIIKLVKLPGKVLVKVIINSVLQNP
jgi:hypothetical protein